MDVGKWQKPTCIEEFGMSCILKNEVLRQKGSNFWIQKLLGYKDLDISKVIIHSYREVGTSLEVVVVLQTSCIFKPIKMGNIVI